MAISRRKLKGVRTERTGFRVPAEYRSLIEAIQNKKKENYFYDNASEADVVIEAVISLADKMKIKLGD